MPVDPTARVAPTARIHPDAVIGPECAIADFCVVESDVVLGARNRLEPSVYIKRFTTLGDDNLLSVGVALGTDPFDRAFSAADRSYLKIGSRNIIREHWTISRGTKAETMTVVGDDNYIMSSGHIAHNSVVGSRCTIAACALVAGYVTVEDQAFISGGVVVHQFSKIGRLAMIGGNVRVNLDVPPYFLYAGFNVAPYGLNLVGLRRAGFTRERIAALKTAYKLLYHSNLRLAAALERIEGDVPTEETLHLVQFIRSSERGICRPEE
jgi:UDP-N-acetylglucosamine acyltransferase